MVNALLIFRSSRFVRCSIVGCVVSQSSTFTGDTRLCSLISTLLKALPSFTTPACEFDEYKYGVTYSELTSGLLTGINL